MAAARRARSARPTRGRLLLVVPTIMAIGASVVVLGRDVPPPTGPLVPAAVLAAAGGPSGSPTDAGLAAPTSAVVPETAAGAGSAPSTVAAAVPSTAAVVPSTVAPPVADSLDEAQILQVLDLVFDFERPFAQKAPYVEGSDQIAPLYDQFIVASQQFGQLELISRDVVAGPDEAQFTFDAVLNGTTVREGIAGSARRIGPAWQITRTSMCEALALSGLTCPA